MWVLRTYASDMESARRMDTDMLGWLLEIGWQTSSRPCTMT